MLFTVIVMIGSSYAWWTSTAEQTGINQITSDCVKITFTDENPIQLNTTYPLTDKEGEELTPYTFKIQNICSNAVDYTVNLGINDSTTLKDEYVAVKLNDNTKRILNSLKETKIKNYNKSYELAKGILNGNESKEYSLRLWMDEHVTLSDDAINKTFSSKVVVEATLNTLAKVYTDDTLNGADPVIKDNLIPVKINEDDGTVTKANIEEKWYDYSKKEWANAVILKEGVETPKDNEEITEDDIESYFVWIPKYKYKIFNMGNYNGVTQEPYEEKSQEIEIEFGIYDTVDNTIECITPGSGENGSCAIDKWMTPSAFTSFNTNGFWVGKFETGYDGATSTTEAEQHNEIAEDKVIIKPNVYSWRNITIGNAFDASYKYQRDLDSHMMKNTEWGAVAYLQHSKYGSEQSVRLNNNGNYMTGYAAKNEPTTGYTGTNESCTDHPNACNEREYPNQLGADGDVTFNYKNSLSTVASTTGNYTGIYDMSGGALEYVMGVMKDASNSGYLFVQSGFSTSAFPFDNLENNKKYYDVYNYSTSQTNYSYRILGDATGEMGPFVRKNYGTQTRTISSWHDDDSAFGYSTAPWFERSGNMSDGTICGIFNFGGRRDGGGATHISFRIVLTP